MKFRIDNALSPVFAKKLGEYGHDVIHVRDINMHKCSDEEIFEFSKKEDRIIVSADTDFGTILALRNEAFPSVIIFRRTRDRKPLEQVTLLMSNLEQIGADLQRGSVVIIEDSRIRVRPLPIFQ